MLKSFDAHLVAYLGAAICFASFCAVGAALLGYGLYVELARLMSGGLAAMLAGAVLIGAPASVLFFRNGKTKESVAPDARQDKPVVSETAATSALGAMARSAFIALAGRRPMAMLGLAALVGALVSSMPPSEKDAHADRRRKSVPS